MSQTTNQIQYIYILRVLNVSPFFVDQPTVSDTKSAPA
jgi:hypothetical protein